jgi:hypothetical protein
MGEAEHVLQQPAESDPVLALAQQNGQRRVDWQHYQHGTPRRSGDSIALALVKPKSPGDWTSAEPRCAGFRKQSMRKPAKDKTRRPYPQRSHRGRLRIGRESDELVLLPGKQDPLPVPGQSASSRTSRPRSRKARPSRSAAWRRTIPAPLTYSCSSVGRAGAWRRFYPN